MASISSANELPGLLLAWLGEVPGVPLEDGDHSFHTLVRRWADDDLRSLNGQIEFLLRELLRKVGRLPKEGNGANSSDPENVR